MRKYLAGGEVRDADADLREARMRYLVRYFDRFFAEHGQGSSYHTIAAMQEELDRLSVKGWSLVHTLDASKGWIFIYERDA